MQTGRSRSLASSRLLAALLLAAGPLAADNLHAPLGNDCEALIVDPPPQLAEEGRGSCWLLFCGEAEPRLLGCGLTELMQVDSLVASVDGTLLAIVSVGEGHPILQVVDLERMLASGRFFDLKVVDPYPGYLALVGWDAGGLLVDSDMPLTRPDEEGRYALHLPEEGSQRYRLRSADWKLEAAPGAEPWTLPNGAVVGEEP